MSTQNPLFPTSQSPDENSDGYVLPAKNPEQKIQPTGNLQKDVQGRDAAANVIRHKIQELYAEEPSVEVEIAEIEHHHNKPSKHQLYLEQIQQNAQSVADIQVQWHNYYTSLTEEKKHEVWREFYAEQSKHSRYAQFTHKQPEPKAADAVEAKETKPKPAVKERKAPQRSVVSNHDIATPSASQKRLREARSAREIKKGIRQKVSANGKLTSKHHFQSLFFGLATGAVVLLFMLFGLFNEMILAPLYQPSRNVSSTPIILSTDGIAADQASKVIIPKINVEIPTDYTLTSLEEDVVQAGLENGVVHYPVTSLPGEKGNTAFFGHSSNNIFNPGKYKFAFVLLSKLENGDMFYLTRDGKVYAYKVFKKQIVSPSDTWILNPVEGRAATATLITCDPPGTTLKRLVVWGEQISPDPTGAEPSSVSATNSDAPPLPGPPESLWQRMTSWFL
jgi:LPXTG-site transpeptidase (sortase) family protein